MPKPILFLDIDGVLNPFEHTDHHCYVEDDESWYRVSDRHANWIHSLMPMYEIVWATWWLERANEEYGPSLGIPPLKSVRLNKNAAFTESPKMGSIKRFAKDRPFVWLDDEISDQDTSWANAREIPTLLVQPNHITGATDEDFQLIKEFALGLLA